MKYIIYYEDQDYFDLNGNKCKNYLSNIRPGLVTDFAFDTSYLITKDVSKFYFLTAKRTLFLIKKNMHKSNKNKYKIGTYEI